MVSQVDEVKSALDILPVVQSYVPSLKPSGRNHFGLCPFHSEKSPSFSVNPELQIYKCFGCGQGGDVIDFIQKIEGLDFPQALELAAKKAGIDLEKFSSPQSQARRKEKQRILDAHRLAADYYHYILTKHKAGKKGLDYAIKKRQITDQEIKEYKLGFAPSGYHNLENFLLKKGFKRDELIRFGLSASKNGRVYDKFRERLMHPIFSLQGEVIGFSGRIIDADNPGPKYLNSPETLIYHKKESLYGLYQAKEAMREKKFCIVVEGNIDVISSARAGLKNIVCPLGTALTIEQLKLLKRYINEIYFAFDTDDAGKKALLRSLELTEQSGLVAKAINLGEYKDVDELIMADKKLWAKTVENSMEIPDFVINVFKNDFNISQASGKLAYLKLVLPFVAKLQDQVKVDHYLQKLEEVTGTKYEVLSAEMQKLNNAKQSIDMPKTKEAKVEPEIIKQTETTTRVPKKLRELVNYIYIWKDRTVSPEKLQKIYQTNLTPKEIILLDLAFSGGMKPKDMPEDLYQRAKEVLVQILQTAKIDIESFDIEVDKELKTMIKAYVHSQMIKYLRALRQKLTTMDEDQTTNELLARINKYSEKLKELE